MSTQVTVFLKLFIYLAVPGLVASRGLQLPDQGPNPSPLHGERRVLVTEPPGIGVLCPWAGLSLAAFNITLQPSTHPGGLENE